jgi:hypothetical protein
VGVEYYSVMGVRSDAAPDEIKRAYRRLARELHPDVNPDPQTQERFKEVTQAYEVLSDPEKRQMYDIGAGPFAPRTPQAPPYGANAFGMDFSDIVDGLFGGRSIFRTGTGSSTRSARPNSGRARYKPAPVPRNSQRDDVLGVSQNLRSMALEIVRSHPKMADEIAEAVLRSIRRGDNSQTEVPGAFIDGNYKVMSDYLDELSRDITQSTRRWDTKFERNALMWEVAACLREERGLPVPSGVDSLNGIPVRERLTAGANETYAELHSRSRDHLFDLASRDDEYACETLQKETYFRIDSSDPERELPRNVRNLLARTRHAFDDPPPLAGIIAVGLNHGYKLTRAEAASFARAGQLIFEIKESQTALKRSLNPEGSQLEWAQIREAITQIFHQESCLAELQNTLNPAMTKHLEAAAERDSSEYLETLGNQALRELAFAAQGREPGEICPLDAAVALCHCIPERLTDETSPMARVPHIINSYGKWFMSAHNGEVPTARQITDWILAPGVLMYGHGRESRVKAAQLFEELAAPFSPSERSERTIMTAFVAINAYFNPATKTATPIHGDIGQMMYGELGSFSHKGAVKTIDRSSLDQPLASRGHAEPSL